MHHPRELLATVFGYGAFRPGQEEIVEAVLLPSQVISDQYAYVYCMLFKKSELSIVDFKQLEVGSVANATLKSFNYQSGFCFGTLVADNESVRAIIGKQTDCPIPMMLQLKGIEVEVMFTGTTVKDGITYPRYAIQF